MKKVHVQDAVGLTLCHDVSAAYDGFCGVMFKRGHVIQPEDVSRMLDNGKQMVYVWEKCVAGEIHEDDAAVRLAEAAPVEGAHYEGPSQGSVTLYADRAGMFRVNTSLLQELNAIEDVSIAALPDHFPVQAGDRLAVMGIVPLLTAEAQVAKAEAICRGLPLMKLLPYQTRRVGIIITGSEFYHHRTEDKFNAIATEKLANYPYELLGSAVCDDDPDMIVSAARRFLDDGADLILISGGMNIDPDDLTPAAIRALGASVVGYGLPVRPGGMTLVAYLGKAALLGIPGETVAAPAGALDVLLPQIFAGVKFTAAELNTLGSGGLCLQCADGCRFPNCSFGRY